MKLTILGTGCAWTKRACASYLLDNNIMIDPGFGSIKQLLKSDERLMHHEKIERIDLVLITHFHSDHYFDIPYILQKSATGKFGENKLMIVCPKSGKEKIIKLCELGLDITTCKKIDFEKYITWCEVEDGQETTWRDLKIKAMLMDHGTTENLGYVITQPNGKKIGFTGDTTMCDNYINMIEECDTVVACMSNTKKERKLFNIVEGIDLMKQYKGRTCIIPAHMTSQGFDYARSHIKIPQDLDIYDLDSALPYDFTLRTKTRNHLVKNFRFKSRQFNIIYGTTVNLMLTDTTPANDKLGILPVYHFNIINRKNGKVMGTINYKVGHNQYVYHNGNILINIKKNYLPYAKETLQLIKLVAISHGFKKLYLSTHPDNNETRNIYHEVGARLHEIKTIGKEEEKYVNNGDNERCIYIWNLIEH